MFPRLANTTPIVERATTRVVLLDDLRGYAGCSGDIIILQCEKKNIWYSWSTREKKLHKTERIIFFDAAKRKTKPIGEVSDEL